MIAEEEETLQRSRQVIDLNPQLKNERVLDGVRAAPDFDAYERLCRGEQLPRQVINYSKLHYFALLYNCWSNSGTTATTLKGKGSLYSTTERRVPGLMPVLGCEQFA